MIKKILFIIIISIFLYECSGYKPIYGKKEGQSFKLGTIETSGNEKLNKIILRNLKTFEKGNKKNTKILNLEIETKLEKKIKSKDEKGNRAITINAIGFPHVVKFERHYTKTGLKFANLMRELTYEHGGAFIGIQN